MLTQLVTCLTKTIEKSQDCEMKVNTCGMHLSMLRQAQNFANSCVWVDLHLFYAFHNIKSQHVEKFTVVGKVDLTNYTLLTRNSTNV